ncbi:MAG: hypothetical protein ACYCSO_08265 [Cuniculiplasma sp.]
MNIVSRTKKIADDMKMFIVSKLMGANPFVINLMTENRTPAGDFSSTD